MTTFKTKADQLTEAYENSELLDLFYTMMGLFYSIKAWLKKFLKK